jgi:hypothetical protein
LAPSDVPGRLLAVKHTGVNEARTDLIAAVRKPESTRDPAAIEELADRLADRKRQANQEYLTRVGWYAWIVLGALAGAGLYLALRNAPGWSVQWPFAGGVSPIRRAVVVAVLLTAVILVVMSAFRRNDGGLRGYLIGSDGRFSTSQTQAALWTLALGFVLACLLLRAPFGETGDTFVAGFDSLDETYLLLLGGPAAAWVLARRVTAGKVDDRTLQKTHADEAQIRDLVSNDDGRADLNDAQFFVFSMLALVYFIAAFAARPTAVPQMPLGLAMLTSAAALIYLGGKGLEKNAPVITSVERATGAGPVRAGDRVRVRGSNFVPAGAGGDVDALVRLKVYFGEAVAVVVPSFAGGAQTDRLQWARVVRQEVRNPRDDRIEVDVPLEVPPGPVTVRVVTAAGLESTGYDVPVSDGRPVVTGTIPMPMQPGSPATVVGRWLQDAGFPGPATVTVGSRLVAVEATSDSAVRLAEVPAGLPGPTADVVVTTTAGVQSAPRPIPVAPPPRSDDQGGLSGGG